MIENIKYLITCVVILLLILAWLSDTDLAVKLLLSFNAVFSLNAMYAKGANNELKESD